MGALWVREVGVTEGGNPGSERPADGGGPGGEAKREDRGGGLRPDAKWVVLLGVLSAAITVLTYVGVSWLTLTHTITGLAASSPSPSPGATQPVPTFPALTSPAPSSPSPTPPSPAQNSGSPAVRPSDFDNVATDPTQISVATMLPQQYNDSGTVFNRTGGSVNPCPAGSETVGVSNTLSAYGCTSTVVGNYLDSSQQIQVTIWVIPLPDSADAEGAHNALAASTTTDWGNWCPPTGVGSQVCQEPWQAATTEGVFGYCYRYLARSLALYVDLRSGNAFRSVLSSAADAASYAVGPQNIPGAQCGPSSAGG